MRIKTKVRVEKEVTEMRLCLKVRDEFDASFHGPDGEELKAYEGYVPGFMPGEHHGDYVELNIDLATGRITNWKRLDVVAAGVEKILNGDSEDDE